jgi:hypothetical protein
MRQGETFIFVMLILVLLVLAVFVIEANADNHELMAMGGYHTYLRSNYLKLAEEYFDPVELNGPSFEIDYSWRPVPWFGLQPGIWYNRVEPAFRQADRGELRVKYQTIGLVISTMFHFRTDRIFSPFFGVGVDFIGHSSSVELDAVGGNTTAGSDEHLGFGVHARAGGSVRIWKGLDFFFEDRLAYIPIPNFAGSGEYFDAGGNFVQVGFKASF